MIQGISFRSGATLVEIMLVVSIMSVLLGLSFPALQAAREAARRVQCQANLRQLAIGSLNFEGASRHLPGPTMNAHPSSGLYQYDAGLFINMLPYLEHTALYDSIHKGAPCNSFANRSLISRSPSFLKCPSSLPSEILEDMSGAFSGPAVNGLHGQSCDYSGNDGAFVNNQPYFGTIRLRVGSLVKERRLADVTDGTSNTLMFWESVGDAIRNPSQVKTSINQGAPESFVYLLNNQPSSALVSTTLASTKSYLFAWSGFRVGTIIPMAGRALNVSNQYGEPLSEHVGLVNVALTDGSVRSISADTDTTTVIALATAQNADVGDIE
ncbi:MAG: DUF1559 domain-containing protein [Planctomycetota bacterium]